MADAIYFDDVAPGWRIDGGSVTVDGDQMVAFAKVWDPLPIHTDPAAAAAAFGGLIAPGLYTMALKQRLVTATGTAAGVIASLGYDELRFLEPVRPGDELTLVMECIAARPSRSKDDRGIATFRISLVNQAGETVLSHLDTILMRKRAASGGDAST